MSYTLSGTVYDVSQAYVVQGAIVTISQGSTTYSAATGSDGKYSFSLPAGTYQNLIVRETANNCGGMIDSIVLMDRDRIRNKTVYKKVSLYGRIVGAPVAGAIVSLKRSMDASVVASTVSDANGYFSFSRMMCGCEGYFLHVQKTDGTQGDHYTLPGALPCDNISRYPSTGTVDVP